MILIVLLFACPDAAQTASLMALISIIVKPSTSSSVTLTIAKELIPNGYLGNLSNKSVMACTASKKISNHHSAVAKTRIDLMAFAATIFIVANGGHFIV